MGRAYKYDDGTTYTGNQSMEKHGQGRLEMASGEHMMVNGKMTKCMTGVSSARRGLHLKVITSMASGRDTVKLCRF